jgi:hypothetical protein
MQKLHNYIENINRLFQTGDATEHTYRGTFEVLLNNIIDNKDIVVANEPTRIVNVGAPDYSIKKKDIPIGYIEAKDIGALEAGRKRGSIKKSREVFLELIEAIKKASEDKSKNTSQHIEQITKIKDKMNNFKHLYEEALNRELMYIERINELEKALKNISSNKIISANNVEVK